MFETSQHGSASSVISSQRFCARLILCALISISGLVHAAAPLDKKHFNFSGFATLGLTKGGNEDLGFHRELDRVGLFDGDWSLAADSLIGVQLDMTVNDQLGGAVQLVGKDRVDDSVENSIEWAFLRYRLNPDWTLRAGRIGFDLFLLSDYRSVGFAYLWTRPPNEFYLPLTFNSFDGADLAWSSSAWGGRVSAKLTAGRTESTLTILGNQVDVEVNSILGGTLSWESDRWQLKLSVTENKVGEKGEFFLGTEPLADILQLTLPIWPEAASVLDDLYVNDPRIRYYALGVSYSNNPWQIQSEISQTDPKFSLYPATMHGYISAGYQMDTVTPYVMYAQAFLLDDPKQAPPAPVIPSLPDISAQLAQLQQGVQLLYDAVNSDQSTLTAGVRWDIRYDIALKVQLDHSWVGQSGFSFWDVRSIPDQDVEITTFSINLNCIF